MAKKKAAKKVAKKMALARAAEATAIDPVAEANNLANLFNDLSQAVDAFRLNFRPPLQQEEMSRLKDEAQALQDRAHHFTAEAIGATLQTIQPQLADITAVTTKAKKQLQNLNNVSKAINIATSALALGVAIAAGDPATIASAAQALATLVL
jgi:hexokinase